MNKKFYLVLDCETATLPFANDIANGNADNKKKIAIARPLIYDIGWTICDRKGEIYDKKQFLIAETFAVPSVFNTAYYAEKRPIYLEMLSRGEITIKPWQEVVAILIEDMNKVDSIGAFNSMFDFKKAIPFTDLYINKLYSPNYFQWEKVQRSICAHIVSEKYHKDDEKEFETDVFRFHGIEYKLFDLWGLAVEYLLNNVSYKKECLNHGLLTNSGLYFKTSAESTFQFLCDKYDFVESHTALDDATIETFILSRIAARGSVKPGIKFFPFRDLGYTDEFCLRNKKVNKNECFVVYSKMSDYLEDKEDENSAYVSMMFKKLEALAAALGIEI